MHLIPRYLIIYISIMTYTAHACSEHITATKHMKPAYALFDSLHLRNLPYLFERCTVTSVSESMNFSACFWRCQQEDACVAFYHEGKVCNICMTNENNVNSLTTNSNSTSDVQTWLHYFVSMEHLNAIDLTMLSNCGQVWNLVIGSIDGENCFLLNGSVTQGTRIYCLELYTDTPREYLMLPVDPDDNYSLAWIKKI